jgi:hypothetical protein
MIAKRRVPVDMDELSGVFELHFDEVNNYLDLETGKVLQVSDETCRLLERLYDELYTKEGKRQMALEDLLAQHPEIHDWQKQTLLEADRVEQGYNSTVIAVDPEPYSDYNDMESFIATVANDRLADRLYRAIRGRGAFRYFKDVLDDHPYLSNTVALLITHNNQNDDIDAI